MGRWQEPNLWFRVRLHVTNEAQPVGQLDLQSLAAGWLGSTNGSPQKMWNWRIGFPMIFGRRSSEVSLRFSSQRRPQQSEVTL